MGVQAGEEKRTFSFLIFFFPLLNPPPQRGGGLRRGVSLRERIKKQVLFLQRGGGLRRGRSIKGEALRKEENFLFFHEKRANKKRGKRR